MAETAEVAHGAAEEPVGTPLTRRELLNYVWLGSIGVFSAQLGAATILFALPRFKPGEFGGVFTVTAAQMPAVGDEPKAFNEGKFWLIRTDEGVMAIYRVCTHLGCLYAWQDSENKFICPCHGSQFSRGGGWLAGPAPRSLDAFNATAVDDSGMPVATTREVSPADKSYGPLEYQEGWELQVNTGDLIRASGREDGYIVT